MTDLDILRQKHSNLIEQAATFRLQADQAITDHRAAVAKFSKNNLPQSVFSEHLPENSMETPYMTEAHRLSEAANQAEREAAGIIQQITKLSKYLTGEGVVLPHIKVRFAKIGSIRDELSDLDKIEAMLGTMNVDDLDPRLAELLERCRLLQDDILRGRWDGTRLWNLERQTPKAQAGTNEDTDAQANLRDTLASIQIRRQALRKNLEMTKAEISALQEGYIRRELQLSHEKYQRDLNSALEAFSEAQAYLQLAQERGIPANPIIWPENSLAEAEHMEIRDLIASVLGPLLTATP
jgi:hypothetical protein